MQLWLATNPDTARHLSREQLEDTADKLGLMFCKDKSNVEIIHALALYQAEYASPSRQEGRRQLFAD